MDSNTWTAKLTIEANPTDIWRIRAWLDEHAPPIPSRNADVLSKYIRCVLITSAEYDNIGCRFALDPPRPVLMPWQQGYEGPWANAQAEPEPRSRLALAVDGFAALTVLACIGLLATFAFDTWPASPHIPPSWYDAGHAAQLMLHHLVALCETC
jgi:hypothetical protein